MKTTTESLVAEINTYEAQHKGSDLFAQFCAPVHPLHDVHMMFSYLAGAIDGSYTPAEADAMAVGDVPGDEVV